MLRRDRLADEVAPRDAEQFRLKPVNEDPSGLVARRNGGACCTNDGLEFALDCSVALLRLEVCLDSLDLRLNICHEIVPL